MNAGSWELTRHEVHIGSHCKMPTHYRANISDTHDAEIRTCNWVIGWKKSFTEHSSEVSEDGEVEPLQRVANEWNRGVQAFIAAPTSWPSGLGLPIHVHFTFCVQFTCSIILILFKSSSVVVVIFRLGHGKLVVLPVEIRIRIRVRALGNTTGDGVARHCCRTECGSSEQPQQCQRWWMRVGATTMSAPIHFYCVHMTPTFRKLSKLSEDSRFEF